MRKLFLLGLAVLAFPGRAHASEPLFASEPLDDEELDAARGGFMLPGGIEVGFGAEIDTSVGGQLLLRTSMQITDQGLTTQFFTKDGVQLHVEGGTATPGAGTISIDTGNTTGTVKLSVEMANLFIQHTVGNTISSLVANTASDSVIDNNLTLNLQLDNVQPLTVGSGFYLIEGLGADAASFRAP